MKIDREVFETQFERFSELVNRSSGQKFISFNEGLPYEWESYKPRLRGAVLEYLQADEWQKKDIGSGTILTRAIGAIEFNRPQQSLTNNLVRWENRWGHASRAHRALLDAQDIPSLAQQFEDWLFNFFQDGQKEEEAFEDFRELAKSRYDLISYLFFLKNMEKFMPIAPKSFDEAFELLGIDLATSRKCSWDNYNKYNAALMEISVALRDIGGISDAKLVDAHSFCWMLVNLEKQPSTALRTKKKAKDVGKIFNALEVSVADMAYSVKKTTEYAQGQTAEHTVKNKDLYIPEYELEPFIKSLLEKQENRCALTGIHLQFQGEQTNDQLLPSLDRKDSAGHYEKDNLQVVCRFINFWKGATPDHDFRDLLSLVRGEDD
jgi:hypothetical protein